jgi:TFIIF-interacting CTD phosphatase-like protein
VQNYGRVVEELDREGCFEYLLFGEWMLVKGTTRVKDLSHLNRNINQVIILSTNFTIPPLISSIK